MIKKVLVGVIAAMAIVFCIGFTPAGGGSPKKDLQQQVDELKLQVENLNLRVAKLEAAHETRESKGGFTPDR